MSEFESSQLDGSQERVISVETGEENKVDFQEAGPQSTQSRELKSILALSKEANFDVNLSKKRKSDQRRASNEGPSKSTMSKKDHRATRFPVTAESELELDLAIASETKSFEESLSRPLKKKKERMSCSPISASFEERKKERKHPLSNLMGDIPVLKPNKDMFCWRCHREGVNIACETCPRSYHSRCLKQTIDDPQHWPCPECVTILKAESTQSRSSAMKGMTLEHLCSLLKFAVMRMKQVSGSDPFTQPVSIKDIPEYEKYIIQPMDLSCLEKNIKENLYGSTHAFEADAKWILHNSIIFNSYQSKLTSVAKTIMKICKQEMAEIENCPTCYLNANTKKLTWFVEVCPKPHLLVWAKLKGFPTWPGKVMSCRDGNVDVRFFGAHDRAWVPERECFLYIPRDPNNFKSKRNDIEKCIQELEIHVDNLKQVFGQFCYPDCKIPIDPSNELKQLQIFLPQYKSYVNRTKRHKLFSVENWKIENSETEKSQEAKPIDANIEKSRTENLGEKTEANDSVDESDVAKDDSELMEGYGTDDEALPEIDMKSRKKLLNKTYDSDQSLNEEKRIDSAVKETADTRSIPSSQYELFEKNFDPKLLSSMNSETVSDSSHLSDKINTVDVLEDMEINLGNDEGSSVVNISRKNSFDSSDFTKSDSESNTSSRKGPIKMDVDNFEVILTSPTKLKIVDKLMKRLSDGSSGKGSEEGSPQHEVVRRLSDEDEKEIQDDRDELSPEPKQLEEPPMDYSESELEITGNDDEAGISDGIPKLEEHPLMEAVMEPSSSKSNEEVSHQMEDEKTVTESPTYTIAKAKPVTLETVTDHSPECLKIKIKISRNEDDKKSPDRTKSSNVSANTNTETKIIDRTKTVNDKDEKSENTNMKKNREDTDSAKSSNKFHEEAQKVIASKLHVSPELDKEITQIKVSNRPPKKIILVTSRTGKESPRMTKVIEVKEKNVIESASVEKIGKSSSKSDLEEWTRKVIGIGSSSFKTKENEETLEDEIDRMEDEDDDIPLARIQMDKENILKVIHSDLAAISTPKETPENEISNVSENLPAEDTSIIAQKVEATSEQNTQESESVHPLLGTSLDANQTSLKEGEISIEKPVVEKSLIDTDLTEVLKEVSKAKNIEIVSEPESNVSDESSVSKDNQSEPDSMSKFVSAVIVSRKRKISSESSGKEEPEMPKLVKQDILQVRKRKEIDEIGESQKKARIEVTEHSEALSQLVTTEEKVDKEGEKQVKETIVNRSDRDFEDIGIGKDKDADKDVTCPETSRKSPEKENELPKEATAPKTPSRKSSVQSNSSNNSNSMSATQPTPDANIVLDEIKSEPESDSEYATESANENLEAKKKYLSALNILERDSEAFQRNKDRPAEIRTRSKTEEKRERSRIVDNITKIIDDVAVNFGVTNKAAAASAALSRRSLDEQPKAASTAQANRSESGEIFVKSFAKIVPTKPRARKSFPQSFATEAKQIQQIKLARKEDSHNATSILRKDLETKPPNKPTKENLTNNSNTTTAQQSTASPMTVLQQLENMTANKSYIIVTQNQDVVLLPPNKPINYPPPPQAVMSVAPVLISSSNSQPSYTATYTRTPEIWRPRLEKAPTASVNLTDSQNYIPFKDRTKQIRLMMSENSGATNNGTPSLSGMSSSRNQGEDEEMPLQSVSSNARDSLLGNTGINIANGTDDFSLMQEDSNELTQTEEATGGEPSTGNSEEDEFRLINNLIPGSVAKVVHEIVQRPPPKLKPRPPGMLSAVFSEGVPSSAGTVTSKINSVAHRLSDYLRGMLIETLDDLGKTDNSEATITTLKMEIEALKHKHSIELSEIEKNMCTVLKDIQRSIVEDRERIIEQTRTACEAETIKRIEEAKSKQWCANCLKEAQFYCCWNTSYCDYPCQQKHWPQHMTKCTQNQNSTSTQSSSTASTPTVVRPLAGQQLILRPTGAKPGTFGRVFAKPVQKVYLNRNTTAPKTVRVQSTNGSFLTVMEAPPGNYQVVSTIPTNSVVRTTNPASKKPAITTCTTALSVAKNLGQKITTTAKVLSHKAPVTPVFEEESD